MATRPKMKGRPSKNRRKGWKKIDIADVEDAIEEERVQERTGGLAANKTDHELFFIDGVPDLPVPIQPASTNEPKQKTKPLKCFANLEPDARIPAISRQVSGHSKQMMLRDRKPVTRKLTRSLQHRSQASATRQMTKLEAKKMHQEAFDLWGEDSNKHINEHFAIVTKKKRVKVPDRLLKKPSVYVAVEAPHPGSSYNPAFNDHQELLQKTVVKQVKEDVVEAKLVRKLKANYGTDGPPTHESYLKEISQGLGLDDPSDSGSEDDEDDDLKVATKISKMKTKKQKRKQKERLTEKLNRLKEKKDRMREDRNRDERLGVIKKQVNLKEKLLAEKVAQRKIQRLELNGKTRRLNKKKFEEAEEDVLLTDELQSSMVRTRCSNSLLEDRFKSLQKRNIIEPRSRVRFRRKNKLKFAEKKPFKEITSKSRAGGGIIIPFNQRKHGEKE